MFILFLIFAIIGMIAGGLCFFIGIALLKADIKNAPMTEEEVKELQEEVREITNEEMDAAKEEVRKPLSPLPYLFGAEGLMAFLGSAVVLCVRMFTKATMAWWILPVALVAFAALSFVVDVAVMSGYAANADVEEEEKEKE